MQTRAQEWRSSWTLALASAVGFWVLLVLLPAYPRWSVVKHFCLEQPVQPRATGWRDTDTAEPGTTDVRVLPVQRQHA